MITPSPDRFAILLDGAMTPTDRLRRQLAGCRVIAADGGIRHASALSLEPEIWLGDFDSTDAALLERFAGVPRETWPSEKAKSDGEIATAWAIERDAAEILFVGALGGERTDHAFYNLAAASRIAGDRPSMTVTLTSGIEEAIPLPNNEWLRPDWPEGSLFSIVAFTAMKGLTVRNAKWPLDRVEVPFGSTWTLSNVAGEALEILLCDGCGIAVCQFQ